MRKEELAVTPIRYVLCASQRHLSIWFDLKANHLTMKQDGLHIVLMPPLRESDDIFYHKIVDTNNGDTR